ncbi:uncharacterized protein BJX67DRAFT_372805 [Aspergillus lucknowensis]|uniref:ATPase AAA-type core domain-containing protein n=1 Tax=Aspergillus lucknowensis TaxID=176173 RepID=A0ABR4LNN9_9EURO
MIDGKAVQTNISSWVVVDATFFQEIQLNYTRPCIKDTWHTTSSGIKVFELDSFAFDGNQANQDFLIYYPTVCCFSFKEKTFYKSRVMHYPKSFNYLKIPHDIKQILLSLAITCLDLILIVPFDDIIKGKGRGINILLHSPIGIGKTFTIKTTIERFNLPLYFILAGKLVINHGDLSTLEAQLDTIFKVAKYFNVVLLLDKVDAFMEQHTSYLDTHNCLLTIFLWKLEYYKGILFLTLNQVIDFDDAILSHIHLKIKYEDLPKETRQEIWTHFLSKTCTPNRSSVIKCQDLCCLESLCLNGQEIKNLIFIAHALAIVNKE